MLRTVQLALEIMTGMCAMLPDSEPHGDDEVEGDDDLDEGSLLIILPEIVH